MIDPNLSSTITQIVLQRLQYAARQVFSGHSLQHLKVEHFVDTLSRNWISDLRTEILTERLKTPRSGFNLLVPITLRYATKTDVPASWWQAFKAEVFPQWLRRRLPPKYRTVVGRQTVRTWLRVDGEIEYDVMAAYPKLPSVYPDCGPEVYVMRQPSTRATLVRESAFDEVPTTGVRTVSGHADIKCNFRVRDDIVVRVEDLACKR